MHRKEIDTATENLIAIHDNVVEPRKHDGTLVCKICMARRKEQLERVTRRRRRPQDGENSSIEKNSNVRNLYEASKALLEQGRLTAKDESIIEEM